MMRFLFPENRPKSWVVFLDALLLGLVLFAPLALVGFHYEMVPLFLFASFCLGIAWCLAAFMALRFAAALYAGHYRNLQPLPWKDQVW